MCLRRCPTPASPVQSDILWWTLLCIGVLQPRPQRCTLGSYVLLIRSALSAHSVLYRSRPETDSCLISYQSSVRSVSVMIDEPLLCVRSTRLRMAFSRITARGSECCCNHVMLTSRRGAALDHHMNNLIARQGMDPTRSENLYSNFPVTKRRSLLLIT